MSPSRKEPASGQSFRSWCSALAHALPAAAVNLALIVYWFAIADRYTVFLYYHDMGPLVPDTSPFGPTTSSRYWMAGLVASGAVLVLYTAASWLLGRLVSGYRSPAHWKVWILSAIPLALLIPAFTMTANSPTLPLSNAWQVTAAGLIGLGLALLPGRLAAERPTALLWLAADGWGMMLLMVPASGIERISGWLDLGGAWWVRMTILLLVAGVLWLLVISALRIWRRTPIPRADSTFAAVLVVSYLFWPLVHHVLGTDGYYYISDSANFFATNVWFQFGIWLATAAVALAIARGRAFLANHFASPQGLARI